MTKNFKRILKITLGPSDSTHGYLFGCPVIEVFVITRRSYMLSSIIERLNDRRDAAGDTGEDAGFTLIELMVVLLILAILLAIAIPTFLGVTGGANDRAAQANLNTALTTAKSAATQNDQTLRRWGEPWSAPVTRRCCIRTSRASTGWPPAPPRRTLVMSPGTSRATGTVWSWLRRPRTTTPVGTRVTTFDRHSWCGWCA